MQYIIGKIRIELISAEIVRLEYSPNGDFCDDDTFFVPNRKSCARYIEAHCGIDHLIFGDYKLTVPNPDTGLIGTTLERNGSTVYSYEPIANSGELPPVYETPQVFAVADSPRVVLPKNGFSDIINGNGTRIDKNIDDIYLIICEGDFAVLRKTYVALTGRPELVRLSTLGSWNSKYYIYDEQSAKQLITDYITNDVPLDNMVIDTDWRKSQKRGIGYDVNTELFPDLKRFFDFAHLNGVEIMFNDHPEPLFGRDVFDKNEATYRTKNLQYLMKLGLDTWWYDRNWHTQLISPCAEISPETVGMYTFYEITSNFYAQVASDECFRRPVIMSNANNIYNGFYYGIKDSASHRYSVQWTGDIESDFGSIEQEIQNMLRAGNSCVPYVHPDCGGHQGKIGADLFVRWMQFGCFSPVLRPHCSIAVTPKREPWVYDEHTLNIVREFIKLRYRLLPVIYTQAHKSYESGLPVFTPLCYYYPDDITARNTDSEYMLGDGILIAPIYGNRRLPLKKSHYVSKVKATYFNGTKLEGEPIFNTEYDELNMILLDRSPHDGVPKHDFSARFEFDICLDLNARLIMRCDDGASVWIDGVKVLEDNACHSYKDWELCNVNSGEKHSVKVEYFQAGMDAVCMFCYCDVAERTQKTVYIPKGEWIDMFSGDIVNGPTEYSRVYSIDEMPLFVRRGAVIPLWHDAQNTKAIDKSCILFDYYPSKSDGCDGLLYEDDGETIAYKRGIYSETHYSARYSAEKNCYKICIEEPIGKFVACDKRNIMLRCHLYDGEKIVRVTVNGKNTAFTETVRNATLMPFSYSCDSRDSDSVCVSFECQISKRVEIELYIM